MSASFKATADGVRALADFLDNASEDSRASGVWFCPYGPTEVAIPGGSIVRISVTGEGDDQQYVINDQIGA